MGILFINFWESETQGNGFNFNLSLGFAVFNVLFFQQRFTTLAVYTSIYLSTHSYINLLKMNISSITENTIYPL